MEFRTDLALEEKERFEKDVEIHGVSLEKREGRSGILRIVKVQIFTEEGAALMHKPQGTYVTLENCVFTEEREGLREEIQQEIEAVLREMTEDFKKKGKIKKKGARVLVAGLGNREATPDALGPVTIAKLVPEDGMTCIAPGVMAQTGLETSKCILGITRANEIDYIIAVDALAARNTARLNTTIQISDTGITPGSGVGNHRMGINEETMGIPVIAIGVPTVVEAATIVSDVWDNLILALDETMGGGLARTMEEFTEGEKKQLVRELMEKEDRDLYVTPKDIDEEIQLLAEMIAGGICKSCLSISENNGTI